MRDRGTLKWLYNSSKRQLPWVLLMTLFSAFLASIGVYTALISKNLIDAVSEVHDIKLFIHYFLLLAGLMALQLGCLLFCQNVTVRVRARLEIIFKTRLFNQMEVKDYSSITKHHSGDLLTRLNSDVSIVCDGIMNLVPSIVVLVTKLVMSFLALVSLDRNFAFIFVVGGVIVLAVASLFRRIMKKLHKQVQETEGNVRSFLQEAIESTLMVKVFGVEKIISRKAVALQEVNYKAKMKRRTISIFANMGLSIIFSIGYMYALGWSAYRLYIGAITFGTLTAVLQLVNQIQSPFASLSGIIPQYYSIIASAERIIEIENLPDEVKQTEKVDAKDIYEKLDCLDFCDLSFNYGRDEVLNHTDLTVKKGDFAVIAGISGIGKSTLLKLLLGVISPETGSITVNTTDGRKIPADKATRPLFSYVPQGHLLLSGTIRESVALVKPNVTDEEIMAAAQISCASDFICDLPKGLDTVIGEKGMGLSEGQVQRLAVTRAILSGAPIILLDEATSALDEETEERLLRNIHSMKNKTCIIISHKKAAYAICNKEIIIQDKKIIMNDIKVTV